MGAIEFASLMLSHAMRRVELSAHNLANLTTPGFKSYRHFPMVGEDSFKILPANGNDGSGVNFAAGKLQNTGYPLDLAIAGEGFFAVSSPDGMFYTRNGQFHRDPNGCLATADGLLLQSESGDVTAETSSVRILSDGTVVNSAGEAVSRIKIVYFEDLAALQPIGGGLFRASAGSEKELENPQIRQGMLESSNVSTADEMLAIMAALRSAECGQRFVQTYDDLMGRVISTFGQT